MLAATLNTTGQAVYVDNRLMKNNYYFVYIPFTAVELRGRRQRNRHHVWHSGRFISKDKITIRKGAKHEEDYQQAA